MLYSDGALRADRAGGSASCWSVALGIRPDGAYADGPKQIRGDRRTPEGWYRTSDKPWSSYEDAILVHYPNLPDADRGLAGGVIDRATRDAIAGAAGRDAAPSQKTPLGGDILLHGGGSSVDWTWGCIALDDDQLDELRAALPTGMRTDLLILP
jgi:murein L,D-transpeptidase YafK